MELDKQLIAAKLRRWEKYILNFRLPLWNEIPDFGLYMEQVIVLMQDYIDYLPPDLKEEQFITAATINNYVRKKIMPEPVKKRYYRTHLAYLIIICSLKQSLGVSTVHNFLPPDLDEETLHTTYDKFAHLHQRAILYFHSQVRIAAGNILDHDEQSPNKVADATELMLTSAVISEFSRVMAEKLLLLAGQTLPPDGAEGVMNTPRKK